MFKRVLAAVIVCIGANALALERDPNDVRVRVVDCGQALCCVVQMPQDRYLIYDAGDPPNGSGAFAAIKEMIPAQSQVELLVLSHSDADHLGAVERICDGYVVKRVLWGGLERDTSTWKRAKAAIRRESEKQGCIEIDLGECEFPMGATYRFGDVFVTMVCGFREAPEAWEGLSESESLNAGSIVVRLEYRGKRVLFCGDAVGRHDGDDESACIATERFMLDNQAVIPIDCDVLIAPHHGADNASSTAFIAAASPEYVIFSAGHTSRYRHPRKAAALRYLAAGVSLDKMFRTDLGDDDGPDEWDHGRIAQHHDPKGDDNVDIVIRSNGAVEVAYAQ